MILNCDIGERGADHAVDRELMSCIGLANLACGGHAGDRHSVAAFRKLAEREGVALSAHLSYPDRKNFGRHSMTLSWRDLGDALNAQWALLPDLSAVKFHGALYHDSAHRAGLARALSGWLADRRVRTVICPADSEMALAAESNGIRVLAEAFAERRYRIGEEGALQLAPRSLPEAGITDVAVAELQARDLIRKGVVRCMEGETRTLRADTLCIHSDSPLALELARSVAAMLEQEG